MQVVSHTRAQHPYCVLQGVLAPIELAQMNGNLDLVETLIEKYGCRMDPSVIKVCNM